MGEGCMYTVMYNYSTVTNHITTSLVTPLLYVKIIEIFNNGGRANDQLNHPLSTKILVHPC